MRCRLPKGEETLPIVEVEGKFLTPDRLRKSSPQLYESLLRQPLGVILPRLLIERMKRRIAQGRVFTIYRFQYELSPQKQLKHMELGDEIGLELIEAEQKLLGEELRILRE